MNEWMNEWIKKITTSFLQACFPWDPLMSGQPRNTLVGMNFQYIWAKEMHFNYILCPLPWVKPWNIAQGKFPSKLPYKYNNCHSITKINRYNSCYEPFTNGTSSLVLTVYLYRESDTTCVENRAQSSSLPS